MATLIYGKYDTTIFGPLIKVKKKKKKKKKKKRKRYFCFHTIHLTKDTISFEMPLLDLNN